MVPLQVDSKQIDREVSTIWTYSYPGELYHHGIKGQKWGIRRFQNKDGSRTLLGRKRRQETEDLSKYSDEELIRKTNRNRVEANYLNSVKDKRKASGSSANNKKMPDWLSKAVGATLTAASTMLVTDLIKNGEYSIIGGFASKLRDTARKNKAIINGVTDVPVHDIPHVFKVLIGNQVKIKGF